MDDRCDGAVNRHLHPADGIGSGSHRFLAHPYELEERHGIGHVLELLLPDRPRLDASGCTDRSCNRLCAQDLAATRVGREARRQVDRRPKEPSLSLHDWPAVDSYAHTRKVGLALDRLTQAKPGPHDRKGVSARTEDFIADAVDNRNARIKARLREVHKAENGLGGFQCAMCFGQCRVSTQIGDQKGKIDFARFTHSGRLPQ
ncbi:MAG TPA: hypothetical protein VMT45_06905 [Thermoanaerobaculaceae bacterium]|nr:hypothetical protein [Thermoanaerobaculaceae bacterium]